MIFYKINKREKESENWFELISFNLKRKLEFENLSYDFYRVI